MSTNPTFDKELKSRYEDLVSNGLTEKSAMDYRDLYKDQPLSVIIDNFRYIVAEPYYGRLFAETLITKFFISPWNLVMMRDVVNEFVNKLEELPNKNDVQLSVYKNLSKIIHRELDDWHNVVGRMDGVSEYVKKDVTVAYDSAYEFLKATFGGDPENEFVDIPIDITNVFDNMRMQDKLPHIFYLYSKLSKSKMIKELNNVVDYCFQDSDDANIYEVISTLKTLLDDDGVEYIVDSLPIALRNSIENLEHYQTKDIYRDAFTQSVNDDHVTYVSTESAIESILNEETHDSIDYRYNAEKRKENALRARATIQPIFESLHNEYLMYGADVGTRNTSFYELTESDTPVSVNDALDFIAEKYNDLTDIVVGCNELLGESVMFEFNNDGTPTNTIRATTANRTVDKPKEDKKKKSKPKQTSSDDDEDDEDEDDDFDIDDEDDEDTDSKSSKKDDRSIDEKKPKEDVLRKIQNKAMDTEMKAGKVAAGISKGMKAVRNTAKAVMSVPNTIMTGITSTLAEWDKKNIERRKKDILRPGYRGKLFRMARLILKYGIIAHFSKALAIVVFILSNTKIGGMARAKQLQIKNELVTELETEIAIVSDKIEDASSDGDRKAKYELMRIKKKLENEKLRVNTNSDYI